MPNPHDDPAALKALQDDIYREKILRARAMTPEQRLAEVFELSERWMNERHARVMRRLNTTDAALGWKELARRLERLRRMSERGFYVNEKPART